MQTLLTLYMVKYLLVPERMAGVVGLDWLRSWHYTGLEGQPLASAIFGDYTSLVYLTPIVGGICPCVMLKITFSIEASPATVNKWPWLALTEPSNGFPPAAPKNSFIDPSSVLSPSGVPLAWHSTYCTARGSTPLA